MDTQIKENFKFTGGDNLTGLLQLYHEAMMQNELRNGYGAYEVSYAGGKSGISFGANQMDLSEDLEVVNLFIDILSKAIDNAGNLIFTQNEILSLKKNDMLSQKKQTLENIFGNNLIRVNMALSSDYGRAAIDAAYLVEMTQRAAHIEKVIQYIKNPAAREFYDSDLGGVLLFDYHNQYNLAFHGPLLENYIDGKFNHKAKTVFTTGEKIIAPTDLYTLEHHKQYIRSTKQWYLHQENCENRLRNIESIIQKHNKSKEKRAKNLKVLD